MRASFDTDLRTLERAYRADPTDGRVGRRYVRALRRAGSAQQAAGVLYRLGDRVEACETLGIRWEADAPQTERGKPVKLFWRDRRLTAEELESMASGDLVRLDPERLASAWPRRVDGIYRLNTTRVLRRYSAHEDGLPHRRLTLLAWTPGTYTLISRPKDRGKHVITISLETRSIRKKLLAAKLWQRTP